MGGPFRVAHVPRAVASVLCCAGLLAGCGSAVGRGGSAPGPVHASAAAPRPSWTPAAPAALTSPSARPRPGPTPALPASGPFALIFRYGPCGLLYGLDTAAGTFTRQGVGATPAATVTVRLTATELARIQAQAEAINFFGYPAQFTGVPEHGATTLRQPAPVYDFIVHDGGRVHQVHWEAMVIQPIIPAAAQLRSLATLIEDTINRHAVNQQLPPGSLVCA